MNKFSKKKEILALTGVILLLLGLNFFQDKVKNFFYRISEPFQETFFKTGKDIAGFFETISNLKDLEKETQDLKIENQELKSQIVTLKEKELENQILKQALDLNLQKDFKLLLSYVASRDLIQESVLINKGKLDGVFEGMAVITFQKVLVGKIEKAYDNFSRVLLITDKNSSFTCKIQSEDTSGVIKGGGNFEIFFDLIPQNAKIQTGQEVITTNREGVFPKGLLVGEIESIEKSDLQPYQRAKIKPAFEFKNLDALFVILDY